MLLFVISHLLLNQATGEAVGPVRTEVVTPVHLASFRSEGVAQYRQGGNPRKVDGNLVFDGASDGNRQVDPQIAVGGGFVLHGTNSGFLIYDKSGNYVDGVKRNRFNDGIDPKMFFDPNNRVFGFDIWKYYDAEKNKPIHICISETADPRGAWNIYPVYAPKGVDGGGIGYSRKWIGYSYPGGDERTFVMRTAEVKSGKPATVYHFAGSLGAPVMTQDKQDDLIFFQLTDKEVVLTTVGDGPDHTPVVKSVVRVAHGLENVGHPPRSPMKGTDALTASGDRNPKVIYLQSHCLWFSHTVNINGRAAVQWHQMTLTGNFVQSGLISSVESSYIETTAGVNKFNDLLVGFQETSPSMFISPRAAWRLGIDPAGKLRRTIAFGTGLAATEGGAWGDYSSSCMDGDNLTDLWTVQSMANEKGRGSMVILRVSPR